jgi:hypothetical protein
MSKFAFTLWISTIISGGIAFQCFINNLFIGGFVFSVFTLIFLYEGGDSLLSS